MIRGTIEANGYTKVTVSITVFVTGNQFYDDTLNVNESNLSNVNITKVTVKITTATKDINVGYVSYVSFARVYIEARYNNSINVLKTGTGVALFVEVNLRTKVRCLRRNVIQQDIKDLIYEI